MDDDELIDLYLKNQLEAEPLLDFENRLAQDEQLKKKLTLRSLIIEGIGLAYAEELKTKLVSFDKSLEEKKRPPFTWKMAAAIALLITASATTYLYLQRPTPSDFDLPEPGLPITMGTARSIAFSNAMSAFKMNDYQKSGEAFESLLISQPQNDTLLYFTGVCAFRSNQTNTAIQKWGAIKSESNFGEKAQYRLAIAYWMAEDKPKAIPILQKISSTSGSKLQKEATQALRALE